MYSDFDKKIDKLLSSMSLKEKVGQLNQTCLPKTPENIEIIKEKIRCGEIGSLILAGSMTVGNDAEQKISVDLLNELQRVAVKESPNKIPLIFGRDIIHGHNTAYPIPLASAASFNPDLIEKCYRNIAKEASADGVHWTFSPMLDICRDPRWGRIVEGPGEDPYIGAGFAKAAIKGFQGENLANEDSLVACAKHYIGYGASEGGRDYYRTEISDYTLQNYYLPAFRAAADSDVGTVMSSFNDISGQPVTSSKKYLTEILRNQLGFEGFVVSDWASVWQLIKQGVANDCNDAAKMSVSAGVDMDMCSDCYLQNLENAVRNGEISEDTIDLAVRRILRVKLAKGLFEQPYCNAKNPDRIEHLKDAYELASESMVLLKNNGVLPLKKDNKIALLGPFVEERRSHIGTWSLDFCIDDVKSFVDVLREKIGSGNVITDTEKSNAKDTALITAMKSDVVVLALGEDWQMTGECRCVTDISLSAEQRELIKKVKSSGKKIVGVFFCARPLALQGVAEDLDAVLYAWHSGSRATQAACDILYGDVVPSGKTAITFPRVTGQIPIYYNVTSSGRYVNGYYGENSQISYEDCLATPYYPFGYGLSYTKFKYSNLRVDKDSILLEDLKNGESFTVSVELSNVGEYDGKETAQLYIRDNVASLLRPLRELKGYKKIFIKQNETVTVSFTLTYDNLGFYTADGEYVVEKGDFEIFVGENCLTENRVAVKVN